ncbi:MAG: hypothetical protein ABIO70_09045 [Pseudomonadota bacterium]
MASLLVLTGWILASLLAPRAGFLERVAYALLFTLAAVPLVAFQLALALPAFLSRGLLAAVAGAWLLGLAWPAWKLGRGLLPPRPERWELGVLALALALGAFTWLHHSGVELWLSLGSYLRTDEAMCFYMQTMSFVPELNPGRDPALVRRAYEIISTPGNSLFTASWMAVLGPWTFRFLHAAFHCLLVLFSVLLLRRWTDSLLVAVLVGSFAALNPYTLWIEVLDRNVLVYALTPALLYTIAFHRERALLHGLLLGLIGGLGLRFLPLVFLVPAALLYLEQRQPWRRWALALLGFALAFAFEVPQVGQHGLHSLGEDAALPALLAGTRTPHVPYDNASYYVLFMLAQVGWIPAALALVGAMRLLRERRLLALALAGMVLLPLLVLAGQRDWIEHDKTRIFIMSLWPVLGCLAFGLRGLLVRAGWGSRALGLAAALTVVVGLDVGLRHLDAPADATSLARKPHYQHERPALLALLRRGFAPSGPLPRYGAIAHKLRWRVKAARARLMAAALLDGVQNPWLDRWLDGRPPAAPEPLGASDAFLSLRVDLEALVMDPERAVALQEAPGRYLVDYSQPARIFDIHHKQVAVSWQEQPLPVTVLAQRPAIGVLRELPLELNAFVRLAEDELGFQKVNLVQYEVFLERRAEGLATSLIALPWMEAEPVVYLRIPADMRVVVRAWLVNPAEGVPHRTDGWFIDIDDGQPRVRFVYGEPESYL